MNIDCIANQIKIYPYCYENLTEYTLGTQKFRDSVQIVDIPLVSYFIKHSILSGKDILHKYFRNLKCVNLNSSNKLSLSEINLVLNIWKINQLKFEGEKCQDEYSIRSKAGSIALHGCKIHHYIKFKNLKICSYKKNYTIQDDYVIFEHEHAGVEVEIEEVTEFCKDYKSLELGKISQPSIIIHKKYIHELDIKGNLSHTLYFEPTRSLSLNVTERYGQEFKNLV